MGPGFVGGLIAAAVLIGAGAGVAGAGRAPLLILGLLALAVAVVVLIWPELAPPVAVFLIYSDALVVAVNSHGAPSAVEVAAPLLLAIPVAASLLRGERLVFDRVFGLLLLLLLVEIASTIASPNPDTALGRVEKFVQEGLIIYLLLLNVLRTPQSLRRAAWSVLAAGAFLSLVAVLQTATGRYDRPFSGFAVLDHEYFLGHEDAARAQGPLADPNSFAQVLLPVAALGAVLAWRERSRWLRILAALAGLLALVAIAFTYSRGAALVLLAIAVGLVILRYLRFVQVLALAAAIAVLLVAVPGYRDRLSSLSSLGGATAQSGAANAADISARSRATENLAAWLVFRDHPFLGVGPGGFGFFYQEYAQRVGLEVQQGTRTGAEGVKAGEAPQRAAHDIFLGVAADLGTAGLVVFVSVLVAALTALNRVRRLWLGRDVGLEALATGLLLALLSYVMAGLFLSLAFERYLYVLLGLAGATARVLTRTRGRTPAPEGWP